MIRREVKVVSSFLVPRYLHQLHVPANREYGTPLRVKLKWYGYWLFELQARMKVFVCLNLSHEFLHVLALPRQLRPKGIGGLLVPLRY